MPSVAAVAHPSLDDRFLKAWEAGRRLAPVDRAVMLAEAFGAASIDQLYSASIGDLQRRLLSLRRSLFGDIIAGVAECGACGCTLEFSLSVEAMLADAPSCTSAEFEARIDGRELEFRLPTVGDLRDAGRSSDAGAARRLLMRRCVLRLSGSGTSTASDQLPAAVCQFLAARIGEIDPLSDITLTGACRECGSDTSVPFDVAAYVWSEIEAWALRLLDDIHLLAGSYGWSEREILTLSPTRRRLYVELASC